MVRFSMLSLAVGVVWVHMKGSIRHIREIPLFKA